MNPTEIDLLLKFRTDKFPIRFPVEFSIGQLKDEIQALTNVPAERQKLPGDSVRLADLNLKDGHEFSLMGTPDAELLAQNSDNDDNVIDDLDYDTGDMDLIVKDIQNKTRLAATIEKTNIILINQLRPGKRLLVFDLDYTLFDCKSNAAHISQLARPGMHELLTSVYKEFEIVIWSQTSWKWLEMKITELGLLTHPAYRIAFVMDRTSMFKINGHKRGKPYIHEVKALEVIWAKFPQFSPKNTLHVDDLARNFAMNPSSGIRIKAFKNGPENRAD
ncbi:MAG: hypothetical protein SGCHY_004985, partial [Lobulomycetales sp.]